LNVAIGLLLSETVYENQPELDSIVTTVNRLQQWQCCPEFIDIDDQRGPVRLLKRGDLYALRGGDSQRDLRDVVMRLPGDDISIVRGTPPSNLHQSYEVLPVYAASPDSMPAVATNRIFFRLESDIPVESVRSQIEALGFKIDDVPVHAPHCAWLKPRSGQVEDALSKLARLRALPGAAHVEPQLLRPRSWKSRHE
jgi:hypothetical protein